ncbi:CRE-RGA-5 protein [Aphelenchoides avenae]|nr:CRE-RGA-5 protein [Aphelenchus avenae]
MSSAFSWLPTRSPKRKVKSDIDSSASPDASSGISLISLCNTADRLPLFVTTCIEYIEEKGGLRMEGIYRVSGSQNLAMELDKYMTRPERLDLEAKDYPLPVVWMSVKNFFGSLHDALIPKTTHKSILECVSSTRAAAGPADSAWSDSVCARLHEVIKEEIPELNRHVLRYLMTHLRRVASNSGQNAMDVRNLAKVWCPTIFQPDFQSFEELSGHLCVFETATVLMLTHSDLLFSPVDSQ